MIELAKVFAVAALATCLVTGCVTPTGGSSAGNGTVIERSKPEAPAWTGLASGRMHEKEGTLSFVQLGTRLRDLPLGLKQTQLAAFEASRSALTLVVKDILDDQRGDLSATSQAELDRRIADVSGEIHTKHAKVTDIYFEKLSGGGDPAEYYNAFVLVTFPKDRLPDLLEALGRRLGGGGDASLRALGQDLLRRAKTGGTSH